MKRKYWVTLVVLLALALLTFGVSQAAPAALGLPWFSVASGGGRSAGGDFTLESSLGQPEAGTLSGGGYTLSGGFLQPAAPAGEDGYMVYLPLVRK